MYVLRAKDGTCSQGSPWTWMQVRCALICLGVTSRKMMFSLQSKSIEMDPSDTLVWICDASFSFPPRLPISCPLVMWWMCSLSLAGDNLDGEGDGDGLSCRPLHTLSRTHARTHNTELYRNPFLNMYCTVVACALCLSVCLCVSVSFLSSVVYLMCVCLSVCLCV